jgi:TPR repeat protein
MRARSTAFLDANRRRLQICGALLLSACNAPPSGGPSQAATSPAPEASASSNPSATSSAAATAVAAHPRTIVRKKSPEERLAEDSAACDKGSAIGCRRVADRYRGYGHVAGCGVASDRPKPRRAVVAGEAKKNITAYEKAARRACELGDAEACFQARESPIRPELSSVGRDLCTRSLGAECPLVLWQNDLHPDFKKLLDGDRQSSLGFPFPYINLTLLYRRDKHDGAGDSIPANYAALAEHIWTASHEVGEVFMMLDKDGFTLEAVAPLKKKAAESLVTWCLEGDCTCGEAARYLEPSDPRRAELAEIGCEDGDPDACYLQGLLLEEAHQDASAWRLFEVACPRVVAVDNRPEIYSHRACDHLAAKYEEAIGVPKDPESAYFYASRACLDTGMEIDHAPCLRLGRYEAKGFGTLSQGDSGYGSYLGPIGAPFFHNECKRASVKEQCEREKLFDLSPR